MTYKRLLIILILIGLPITTIGAAPPIAPVAAQQGEQNVQIAPAAELQPAQEAPVTPMFVAECNACHADKVSEMAGGLHASLQCEYCHEGTEGHLIAPEDPTVYPRVHFDQEVCATAGCHVDQYNTFEIASRGRTVYGGSDDSAMPPKGWSKTLDLPYWNVLIDGHPFVLETYEDSPMADNQIEHQETIRPGSEACLECHGTKVAFAMGIEYTDKNGVVHSIPATKSTVTLPNGTVTDIPAKEYTIKSTPSNRTDGHIIYDGTAYLNGSVWDEALNTIVIPIGTKVWTYTDGVNLSSGPHPQLYEVKTLVTLPVPVTVDVLDNTGAVVGQVTFDTVASYPDAGADINGRTGFSPPAAPDGNVATVARNWIYSALEAVAFDGLDYAMMLDPTHLDHFLPDPTQPNTNWPSIQSGELCNQCHNPHSGAPRIVKKSLIAAISQRGINPYSPTGMNTLTFEGATRQDQIIALCAQCHSEYVGGYSANTKLDQDYFPWAKPTDLENQYNSLFGYLQDWSHGAPIVPWQSVESNARGFRPYGLRWPIGAPLVKVQHPEAEQFLNSTMYNAGATCTDCHSARITRPDGTKYTSHWFTSPLKLMAGFTGVTETGVPVTLAPQNPCVKCHTTDTLAQSQQKILTAQANYFTIQERAQVALANALKFINGQPAGTARDANVALYQRASMRWEYYSQAENSMGFHNNAESITEVANARIWADSIVPWPLTPVTARVTAAGADTLTVVFYDQATDEKGFIIERATALEGPYSQVASIPTPNGFNLGDVQWTDTGLAAETPYYYRVAAYGAGVAGDATYGPSVYSVWATGTTTPGVALPAPANLNASATIIGQIDLTWTYDPLANETGFRVERAPDVAGAPGTFALIATLAADTLSYSDTGLPANTTYHYRVFAVQNGTTSAASNTDWATTLAAPPNAPSNLRVTAVGRTNITIAWNDNSANEDGFYVERSGDSGKTWARIATTAPDAKSYNDTGLVRRRTYQYRVQAFNASGTSAYSNIVSAKTK